MKQSFKQTWNDISRDLDLNPEKSSMWLSIIQEYYYRSNRNYHNIDHISNCLHSLHMLKQLHNVDVTIEMKLAIIFHDIVYDPFSKTNEENSVKVFETFIHEISEENIDSNLVKYFILGTKHNKDSREMAKTDKQLGYVLDADLAILGAPKPYYDEYMKGVRLEYIRKMDVKEYDKGRYNFLYSLLQLDSIFYTEEFKQIFEKSAKRNIKYEMALLKEKFI